MNEAALEKWGLSGFVLKWIAMITMAIDHVGATLYPEAVWMRCVGRIAFPIYCFLLVEGAIHTSSRLKYLVRLFLFALISEIPFDLMLTGTLWYTGSQNVFFTLFLGLLAVCALDVATESPRKCAYSVLVVAVAICAAFYFNTDYSAGGVLIILCFYVFHRQKPTKAVTFAAVNFVCYEGLQNFALLSLPFILCYNGKRGPNIKYLFYVFYPAHLLVLYWIKFHMQ